MAESRPSRPTARKRFRLNALISLTVMFACVAAVNLRAGACTAGPASPSVTICSPQSGATAASPVQVSAAANSSPVATLIQIYLDGAKAYEVKASSLDTSLAMSTGSHRLTVQAYNGTWFKTTEYITVSSTSSAVSVSISPASATVAAGGTQQLSATVTGSSDTSVTWSVDGVTGGNSSVGTISSTGLYTAPSSAATHTVTATSNADATKSASASVTVTAASAVSVSISPTSAMVAAGGTQQFTATVTGNSNTSVTWSVDGIVGGSSSAGTISTAGLYTAPSSAAAHMVTATSNADNTKSASATVTVTSNTNGPCTPTGAQLSVTICAPANGATVTSPVEVSAAATSTPAATLIQLYLDGVKAYEIKASSLDTQLTMGAGAHRITVQAYNGTWFKTTEQITVSTAPAPVSVRIAPSSATLNFGATQQFTATVTGSSDTSVAWSVDSVPGGNSTNGTISSAGVYTAPTTTGTHTVTATSNADSSKSASASVTITNFTGVFTRQYDNARTGQNLNETILTPANVNSSTFGKLCSYPVDGSTIAEPLYGAGLNMGSAGVRNVVFVATMHDSVYAFDAECRTATPFWQVSFINPAAGITTVPGPDIGASASEEYGIVPTPVIDPSTKTLYVLARTKENGTYHQRLHALDLITGAEKFGGPVEITATVPGNGDGSSLGTLAFDPLRENSRPGMLLLNGVVYMAWASIGDIDPYHGWVIGYDAQTLAQVAVFNATPNGKEGGIWQSEAGLAADASGNIYAVTGNGTFDASSGGPDYGETFLKLNLSGGNFALADYFTPFNYASLNSNDHDLGSGGPVLLPPQAGAHPNLVIAGSKDGTLYLVDRDQMGHVQASSNSQIVQTLIGAVAPVFSAPAYWNGNLYFVGVNDYVKAFPVSNGLLSAGPTSTSPTTYGYPGATPSVSANGNTNGIVWTMERALYTVLHAYDATNLNNELYNSEQLPSRDRGGLTVEFVTPMVANGRVYMGCNQSLVIYGLLH